MAFETAQKRLGTQEAAVDHSANQFKVVTIDSAGKIALAGLGEGDGLLANKPKLGQAAEVITGGPAKGLAGAAIAAGVYVTSDANGKLKAAVLAATKTDDAGVALDPLLGSHVLGKTLEASTADGDIITVDVDPRGALPTTLS